MTNSIYPTIIWLVAILIGSLGLVIYIGSINRSSRAFAFSIFWVTLWVTAMGFFISAPNYILSDYLLRIVYFLGIVISTTFLNFFIAFPTDVKINTRTKLYLLIFTIVLCYLIFCSDNIVFEPVATSSPSGWTWTFGPLFFIYEFYFFGCFIYGIGVLYSKFLSTKVAITKKQLKFMLWVIIVGIIPPGMLCIILPQFGYFYLDWLGPVTELIWIPIIAYSIFKYQQMNVRAVVAEVLAIGMTAIFFINIFINLSWGPWVNIMAFSIFLILATYLIRTVLREAKQTELLKILNDTLSFKVAEQTAEIRSAFELEKHARRELEKLNETKDQFIMITQHHLRAPVNRIKNDLSSTISGENGKISMELAKVLRETDRAASRLGKIVDDFLNISTLKVGSQILDVGTHNLLPLVTDVLGELKIDIEKMHLKVVYPHDTANWPDLQIDASKMREVLLIILENAVKYNVDGGKISMQTRITKAIQSHVPDQHDSTNGDGSSANTFELTIENTGVGMTSEDMEKLFARHFFRSKSAQTANPIGMGIGLSVARAVVRAHHGTLEIESEGEGKGARVRVRVRVGTVR
ncbi:MAG: ATP-binding protein [Candidatus Taylorbacteria bacterium]